MTINISSVLPVELQKTRSVIPERHDCVSCEYCRELNIGLPQQYCVKILIALSGLALQRSYVGHTESNKQQFFYKLKFIVM